MQKINNFLIFFSSFVLCFKYWLEEKFNSVTYDQLIYHLIVETEELATYDSTFVWSFILNCFFVPLFILIIWLILNKKFLSNYLSNNIFRSINNILPALLCLFSLLNMSLYLQIINKFENPEDIYDKYYISADLSLKNKDKRNLIIIYAESLEQTYFDLSVFDKNLLSRLESNLSGYNKIRFNNFVQMPGTGWTVAGIVSSNCGLPLRVSSIQNANKFFAHKKIMPKAICLGDILKFNGYRNIFLGGAPTKFAGKKDFLSRHGFDEVFGAAEWKLNGVLNDSDWALDDDLLFKEAKKKVKELVAKKRPFALVMLTYSTHGQGHLTKSCKSNGGKDYADILTCSVNDIVDFLLYLNSNDYLANTDVLIMGDHLVMMNPLYDLLSSSSNGRRIFNLFITNKEVTKSRETITHFDIFPTVLDLMGFEFESKRLALGVSGFSLSYPTNTIYSDNYDKNLILFSKSLRLKSERYENIVK
jgi:phosphoglycerol transferase